MYPGSLAADQGVHPHEVSGVGAQAADQSVRSPGVSGVGPRPLIGVHTHPGALGLCAQATGPLIWVHTDHWL